MVSYKLETTATVPTDTSLEIILFEDASGDGSYDNYAVQSIDDGQNQYFLDGFDGSSGNDVWTMSTFENTSVESAASLDSVAVEPGAFDEVDVFTQADASTNSTETASTSPTVSGPSVTASTSSTEAASTTISAGPTATVATTDSPSISTVATESSQTSAVATPRVAANATRGDTPSLQPATVSPIDARSNITDTATFSYPTFDTLEVYGERGLNDEPAITESDVATLLVESLGLSSDDPGPEPVEALIRQAIDDALSSDDPTIQTGVVSPIDALAGVDIAEAITMVDTASAQTSTLSIGALTQAGDVPIAASATASPLTEDATTHSTDTGFVDLVATPRTTGSTGIADDSGMVTLLVVPLTSTDTGIADTVGLVPLVASPRTSDEFSSIVESPDLEPIVASMLGDTTGASTDGATLSPFVADSLTAPGNIVLPRSLAQATVTPRDATISIAESDALEQLAASPLTSDEASSTVVMDQYVPITVQAIVDTNSLISITTDPTALTASPRTPQSSTLSTDDAVVQPIVASLLSDEIGIADDTPNIVEILAVSRRGLIARNEAGTVTFISSDTLLLDEQQVIRGGLVRDAVTPVQITMFADPVKTVDAGIAPRKVSTDGRNRVELTSENLLVEKVTEEANDVERLDI